MGVIEIGLFTALNIALDIYAIWLVLHENSSGLRKVLWIVAILMFPMLGMLLYLVFFRRDPSPPAPPVIGV